MKTTAMLTRTTLIAVPVFAIFYMALRSFALEYPAVLLVNGTTNGFIDAAVSSRDNLPQPVSARTQRDLLALCGKTITLSPRLRSEPALKAAVAQRCSAIAQALLEASPSNARALAVLLLTAGDIDPALLRIAQAAAPYEPWPLNLRMQAVGAAQGATESVSHLAQADYRRALVSNWGRNVVASLYRSHAGLRAAITAAAESAGPADQRRFLEALRHPAPGLF